MLLALKQRCPENGRPSPVAAESRERRRRFLAAMKCWICGKESQSAEHMIKASDINSMFGHVSQKHPLFRRVNHAPREIVQGTRSAKLKFNSRLCSHCNNARTQKHDKSWEALSKFLRERKPPIRAGAEVRLSPAFRDGVQMSMMGVHLYFLKLFGCLITDNAIPIEIQPFSEAILNEIPHPSVYLSFLSVSHPGIRRHTAITSVETVKVNSQIAAANWFYFVGPLAVNVTYAIAVSTNTRDVHLWHPSFYTKSIVIDRLGKAESIEQ